MNELAWYGIVLLLALIYFEGYRERMQRFRGMQAAAIAMLIMKKKYNADVSESATNTLEQLAKQDLDRTSFKLITFVTWPFIG